MAQRRNLRQPQERPGRPNTETIALSLGETAAEVANYEDSDGLSFRQRQILLGIKAAMDERGYPPSVREIAAMGGLASSSSAAYQLKLMEAKGYISRDPHRPRALVVRLPASMQEPHSHGATTAVNVPMVGQIAAGGPILAQEVVEDYFALPKQLVGEGTLFMLKVTGDSMIDAAICDGDFVVVRQQPTAENGEIVAALLGDEATVKTLKKSGDQVWLMPHNLNYSPIDGNQARIMGKVVSVLRRV
ncbi:MAG: transcriptional repressor LexA [Propionibacteriaceae bacterium]|nr:transcriptional repressor LexA [Propionibacteriaceae bacterium]